MNSMPTLRSLHHVDEDRKLIRVEGKLTGDPCMVLLKESHPWDQICCAACWNALGKRCKCHCLGKHHSAGIRKNNDRPLERELEAVA